MTDDRLSYLLDIWREHMHERDAGLGYPSEAAGILWRPSQDFEQMVSAVDHTQALAVDASVDSLPPNENAAVYGVVMAVKVWRFREPMEDAYARAREMLKIKLHARGIE